MHSTVDGDAVLDGGLTKSGTGTLTITGANTYTGATRVTGGTLRATSPAYGNFLSNAGGVSMTRGTLQLNYTGGVSPVLQVRSILNGGYAGGFAAGQIKGSSLATGLTLGYGDNGTDTVTVMVTLPGDATLDGKVDFSDFLALQTSFGQANTRFDQGNFNYDGATNFGDFLILQTNFGQSVTGGDVAYTSEEYAAVMAITSAGQVPEPATLAALGLGGRACCVGGAIDAHSGRSTPCPGSKRSADRPESFADSSARRRSQQWAACLF